MAVDVRAPRLEDADRLGEIHVRAWQEAYKNGLMPDEYLAGLSVVERADMWRVGLSTTPRPRHVRLVAEVDGQVVGFMVAGVARIDSPRDHGRDDVPSPDVVPSPDDATVGEIFVINVHPDNWGTGVGSELFDRGCHALRTADFESAILWVHSGNDRAKAFYERKGWVADGRERVDEVFGVTVPEVRYAARLR